MEEIINQLTGSAADTAIATLSSQGKNAADVTNNRLEYSETKRDLRPTQIATTQKDKIIPAKDKQPARNVTAIRIPFAFQKKIVKTATAFEVGERVILTPNEQNPLSEEIARLWTVNRIDNKIQQLIEIKKSETESAIMFYIEDINKDTQFNRLTGPNPNKEIKCSVLSSKGGVMSPYFDAYGDMKAFVWKFTTKDGDKDVKNTWVWDENNVYKFSDKTGSLILDDNQPHGFSKIPVVYLSQDKTEWYDVQEMIDRFETAMSKLGASNDYSGHPLLKIYGEAKTMPDKNDDGKTLRFETKADKDGKITHGNADFLTNDNAPEAVKLELEKLEDLIYSMTSTPKLSFNDLAGLGAVSGIAIKLMFLDTIIKSRLNEGENRTTIERILNVLISGIVTTTVVSMKSAAENLLFDVSFKSIIPMDTKETIDYLVAAKQAQIVSEKTAIEVAGIAGDVKKEQELIEEDRKKTATTTATPPANNPPV